MLVVTVFSAPKMCTISWAAKNWKALPMSKDTHISGSSSREYVRTNALTTTSVSSCGYCEQCGWHATSCKQSTSLWLQRAKDAVSMSGGLLKTSSPPVMTSSLFASWNESGRNLNSSVLFLSTLKKLAQFSGVVEPPTTHFLTPFLCLVF